jgi:hypothetical protein
MNVKRILKVVTVTMVLFLAALSPCYAARIYNDTNVRIYVSGTIGPFGGGVLNVNKNEAVVNPGQRSDSLNWTATEVSVHNDQSVVPEMCHLGFGPHLQIIGGNYMVVSSSGNNTNCVVCDSNHNPIAGSGSC